MKRKMSFVYKFVMDATVNYIFFVPVFIVLNTIPFFLGLPYWNLENIVTYAVSGIVGSFILGGVYGRVLNMWRKRLNYH